MTKRLAQHIRGELDELVDHYDARLRMIPGYAELPAPARHDLERHVLELMATCLETNNDQPLIDYICARASQVLAAGFDVEWFQQAVAVLEKVVMPLVETVAESNFVWKAINRAQQTAWHSVVKERRRTESNLPDTDVETRFRTLFEKSADAYLIISDGLFVDCNQATVEMMRARSKDEMLAVHPSILSPEFQPDGRRSDEKADEMMHIALEQGSHRFEWTHRKMNGEDFTVEVLLTSIALGGQQVIFAVWRDITERKQSEQAIQESEQRFRTVADFTPSWETWLTPDGRLNYVSPSCQRISGYSPQEFVGRPELIVEITHPEDHALVESHMREHSTTAETEPLEYRLLTKDGQVRWINHVCAAVYDAQGRFQGRRGSNTDVTVRKQLEREIQESWERRGRQVQTGTEIAQEIAAAPALDELFKRVVTLIKERFSYYHAQIFRYDPAQDAVVLVSGYGEAGQKMLASGHKLTMGRGVVGTAAITGRSILAADVAQDKDWRPNPYLPETKGELAVPIKLRNEVLGILDVQSDRASALTQEDQLLLEGLCGQIAVAIESRRVEDALREREEDLNVMLEYSPEAVGVVNTQTGLFENVNRAAERLYGLPRGELVKVGPAQMSPEFQPNGRPSQDAALEQIGAALSGETPVFEWMHLNASGQEIPCEVRLVGLTGERHHLVRFSVTDITSRRQAEEELRGAQQFLDSVLENLPIMVFIKEAQNLRFVRWNKAGEELVGFSRADMVGKNDYDFFPKDEADFFTAKDREVLNGKVLVDTPEEPIQTRHHGLRLLHTRKIPILDEQGNPQYLLGISEDITERKAFEKALTLERQLLRTLIDNLPDLVFVKDRHSKFLINNVAHANLFGHTPEEIRGKSDFDFFPRELAERYFADEQALMQEGRAIIDLEEPSVDATGKPKWHLATKLPLRDVTGEVSGLVGVVRDITARREAEAERSRSAQLLRTLMQTVPDYFYIKNTQSEFVLANQALADVLQLASPDELTGKTDFDFFPRELAEKFYQDEQAIIRSGQPMMGIEEPSQSADGRLLWVSTSKVPFRGSTGEIEGIIGLGRDITERKQAEAELERLLADQQKRTLQLQTAAEVSRAASSILNVDELLPQAVELIRARFGLYYVGIFLLDEAGRWARLRAGTGDAGQQMLAAGHQLKIGGTSMISQCISQKAAQIALDVGEAAVRFNNPLLPLTRSEAALPLISRGHLTGAITIQSDQPAAFDADDVTILQSMADQISNAVENARLYEQARAALAEVDATNRRLTGEAWESYLREQVGQDVICVTDDAQAAPAALLKIDDKLSAGEITLEQDEENRGEAIVTAPILLRGQPIGALRLRTSLDDWDQDMQAVLSDMAGHIAQAVENARLVEQTQRTASRERAINEINARVRQTIDLDTILQTAVNELGQTLKAARVVARVGVSVAESQPATGGNGRGEKNG